MKIISFQIFLEWVDLKGLARDRNARDEIVGLFNAWEKEPRRWTTTYGYNVSFNRYEYISGEVRRYVHRSQR